MEPLYSLSWVETQVAHTIEIWQRSAAGSAQDKQAQGSPQFSPGEQRIREQAYDRGLLAAEREVKLVPRSDVERRERQGRILAFFSQFSSRALDLDAAANLLLTRDFLPVGIQLARWARRFDPDLSMADIIQACRNAWTACGMQPLLGERVRITPAILGYSLLYPYSDNYLDSDCITAETKLLFSQRFRRRLLGEKLPAANSREAAVWRMVQLIENQYPRAAYPDVFHSLLAIHHAQEASMAQVRDYGLSEDGELLRLSCAKGGTSVLADACLARGRLNQQESLFSFEWGVLLQLGDDLQDVREDLHRGSITLFSRAVSQDIPLDGLVVQLLDFSRHVGNRMEQLPHGSAVLKDLLRMSWRSLIIGAVANSHEYFSRSFLNDLERSSPFSFAFLRARRARLANGQGLYSGLFDAFLETPEDGSTDLPLPEKAICPGTGLEAVAAMDTLDR